jgi:hypothetical protein
LNEDGERGCVASIVTRKRDPAAHRKWTGN